MGDMVQTQLDHSHWVNQTMNKLLAASHLPHLERSPTPHTHSASHETGALPSPG